MAAELKTYEGWMQVGRMVSKGEKAEFYLVSPDGAQARAMFSNDQTKSTEAMDGVWTKIVPASERPRKPRDTRPKLKMTYVGDELAIWCGPDKKVIANLKRNGFTFDKYSHRWRAPRSREQFAKAVRAYEAEGYAVDILEVEAA